MSRKVLLVCGILSSLLYIAMNIVVAMQYDGYSSVNQTISELSAIGAPSKPLWDPLVIIYDLLLIAFGLGVRMSAGDKRALRVAGSLIVAAGALVVLWPFAPMHRRDVLAAGGGTMSDFLHVVLGSLTLPLMAATIGFGAKAFGNKFRLYSIGTILTLLVSGALMGMEAPKMSANLPTPWIGIWERICLGGFLLWAIVLAVGLLRTKKAREPQLSPGGAERVKNVAVFAALFVIAGISEAFAQAPEAWFRRARLEGAYDLRGTSILVVVGSDFNYQETVEMAECWKRWGARVEFTGSERSLTAESDEAPGSPSGAAPATLLVDWLLSEVDPSHYDVLYVAGGEGVTRLLTDHRPSLARLIDGVHARGRIVSAICHGPTALAASTAVKGRRVTVQGTAGRQELEQAGAVLINEAAVVDGTVVTGQWPHLEEFAVTLAECVQYPGGGGPHAKALASRSPAERVIDDLRDTHSFDGRTVPLDALESLVRAAQRAIVARGARGARAMRLVAVSGSATKAEIASRLFEKCKSAFIATGIPESVIRTQIGQLIEGAPLLLFQFVEIPAAVSAEVAERLLRADTAFAGAAFSNLALVARSLGLGVSAIGMPQFFAAESDIRQILSVPDNQRLTGISGLGYSVVSGTPAVARPGSDLLFLERWNAGNPAAARRQGGAR